MSILIELGASNGDLPQWVTLISVIGSMQMIHCTFDSLVGTSNRGPCCSLILSADCCSNTLDNPSSS